MPIYEYRCANGHTFELFQKMTDPPARKCDVCGVRSVEKVLFPVAVHFKGSGFYSTDYGRGSKKGGKDEGGGSESKSEKSEKSDKSEGSGKSGKDASGGAGGSSSSSGDGKPGATG